MIQKYAYEFRLYPTEDQKVLLNKHFGCVRWVWNHFLERRKSYYLEAKEQNLAKKSLYYSDNCGEIVQLKKQEETRWLTEVCSQALQQTIKDLDSAYSNFFHKVAKFPKFKSKYGKNRFRSPQGIQVENGKLYIHKFREGIAFDNHREIEGKIKHCVVKKSRSGNYFVSILTEREIEKLSVSPNSIGIDLGIKDLIVTSEGFKSGRLKQDDKLLRIRQKKLSRSRKQSNNRNKARLAVAKLHQYFANQRKDFLHKLSTKIINENQVIVLENLSVKNMMQNHKLAKAIGEASWNMLLSMLKYKAAWYGREIVQVSRWFPSSKTCNDCNYILESLPLSVRKWTCPRCEAPHDRDINAAKNILKQGLNLIPCSVGATV